MSDITFTVTNRDGSTTISVFGPDFEKVVTDTHPFYSTLLTYLTSNAEHDADLVRDYVDPTRYIGKQMNEVSPDLTWDMHHLYYQGVKINGPLADEIKRRIGSMATDWTRLAKFLVNLEDNPSKRAKDAVWGWVEKHGVSITEDGLIVGYKGLVNGQDAITGEENVPVSYHAGPNNFIDGVLYGETDVSYNVPHRLGTTISKRRADVDDNNRLACSTGLHVGAYSYAKTFGENREDGARYSTMGRMADTLPNSTFALVTFNPADVVSVPEDGTADWKIRVAAYTVLEFLEEVKDVLDGMPEYPVKQPAPFIPRAEKAFQEEQPPVATYQEPEAVLDDDEVEALFEDPFGEEEALDYEDADDPEAYDDITVYDDNEDEEDGDFETEPVEPTPEEVRQYDTIEEFQEDTPGWADLTLAETARRFPGLLSDLHDGNIGHKPLARKWAPLTTESSVRRYRKAHNVKTSFGAKVRDTLS